MLLENIKAKCKEKGMSVAQLEREAGITARTIIRWDEVSPSYDKVVNVAKVLGCTVEELIGE